MAPSKFSVYQCDQCAYFHSSKRIFKKHLSDAHCTDPNDRFQVRCTKCNAEFASLRECDKHIRAVHEKKPVLGSQFCDAQFHSKLTLNRHHRMHLQREMENGNQVQEPAKEMETDQQVPLELPTRSLDTTGTVVNHQLAGPAVPNHSLAGSVMPNDNLAGPAVPNHSLAGSVMPNDNLAGPEGPNHSLAGPAVPNHSLAGSVMPNDNLAGPAVPNHSLAGSVMPNDNLAGPVVPNHSLAGPAVPNHSLASSVMPNDNLAGPVMPNHSLAGPSGSHLIAKVQRKVNRKHLCGKCYGKFYCLGVLHKHYKSCTEKEVIHLDLEDEIKTEITEEPKPNNQQGQSGLPTAQQNQEGQSGLATAQQDQQQQSGQSTAQQDQQQQSGLAIAQQDQQHQSGLATAQQNQEGQSGLATAQQDQQQQSGLATAQQDQQQQSGLAIAQQDQQHQSGLATAQQNQEGQSGLATAQQDQKPIPVVLSRIIPAVQPFYRSSGRLSNRTRVTWTPEGPFFGPNNQRWSRQG